MISIHLMYAAKQGGKNSVNYYVYNGKHDNAIETANTVEASMK